MLTTVYQNIALKNIFTKIESFKINLSYEQLRLEYIDFVSKWDKL